MSKQLPEKVKVDVDGVIFTVYIKGLTSVVITCGQSFDPMNSSSLGAQALGEILRQLMIQVDVSRLPDFSGPQYSIGGYGDSFDSKIEVRYEGGLTSYIALSLKVNTRHTRLEVKCRCSSAVEVLVVFAYLAELYRKADIVIKTSKAKDN